MARSANKQEVVLYQWAVNPNTRGVIRHIEDSRGKHYVDVRQAFRPNAEDEDAEGTPVEDQVWAFTRYGLRLDHAALAALQGFTLPKNPVDTKTVTTRVDDSIKLGAVDGNGSGKAKVRSTRTAAAK